MRHSNLELTHSTCLTGHKCCFHAWGLGTHHSAWCQLLTFIQTHKKDEVLQKCLKLMYITYCPKKMECWPRTTDCPGVHLKISVDVDLSVWKWTNKLQTVRIHSFNPCYIKHTKYVRNTFMWKYVLHTVLHYFLYIKNNALHMHTFGWEMGAGAVQTTTRTHINVNQWLEAECRGTLQFSNFVKNVQKGSLWLRSKRKHLSIHARLSWSHTHTHTIPQGKWHVRWSGCLHLYINAYQI